MTMTQFSRTVLQGGWLCCLLEVSTVCLFRANKLYKMERYQKMEKIGTLSSSFVADSSGKKAKPPYSLLIPSAPASVLVTTECRHAMILTFVVTV
jgi:hypothetical protein